MATILEFRTLPGRARTRALQGAEQAACQVVIFPGVRVAYWDDVIDDSDDMPPRPRSATRKNAKQKRPRS